MWTVVFDNDHKVDFDDLPVDAFEQIADKHGLAWTDLYYWPATKSRPCFELIAFCASRAGVPAPARPDTMGDFKRLSDLICRTNPNDMSDPDAPTTPGPLADPPQETPA